MPQAQEIDRGEQGLSSGTNPTTHIYSADQTFKQSSAYGVVASSTGPQSQGHTQSTVIPASVQTNTGLSVATGINNMQHPAQYNSVILNSASSVSQANQKNNNTFGLG